MFTMERMTYTGFVAMLLGVLMYGIGILVNLDKGSGRPEVDFDFMSILLIISGAIISIIGRIKKYKAKKFEKNL